MAQAPLILTSMTDCGKQEAAVLWDPIAGKPVASFSGEYASPGTLTVSNSIIFSAVPRKPIIQAWSFQSVGSKYFHIFPCSALEFFFQAYYN